MSLALPAAWLCLPAPGDTTLAGLLRKVRLRALRALLSAPAAPGMAPPSRAALPRAQVALAARAKADPEGTLAAIGAPDVLPALLCLEAGLRPAGPLLEQALAALIDGRRSPSQSLACGIELALDDSNPLRDVEAHPDKSGNALDLGGQAPEAWVEALDGAWSLLEAALPEWTAERSSTLQRLIPVGFAPERHFSATYREAPGLAYLSLHPDPLTLAEALVHEGQHSRLNLLHLFDPVLENGATTWTASPVRPDLRPLIGVLLAVHAFVPVAALHARLAAAGHPLTETARFAERRRQVLSGNQRGVELIRALGSPTRLGARLVGELLALHDHLCALAPEGAVQAGELV